MSARRDHRFAHGAEIAVEQEHHVVRQLGFRQFGEGADVGEQDRDLALAPLHEINAAPSVGFSNYELNGVYQLTATVALSGSYTYTQGSAAHWHNGGLQADYQFSKRTDTYLEAIYQHSSAGAPAVINSADPSSTHNQVLIGAGLRHRF